MATLRALGVALIIAVAAATSVDAMEPALAQLLQLMRSARQDPAPPTIDKIATVVAMPGGTMADPILQRDALNYAQLGATAASKDCKQFEVIDTRFEGFGLREPKTADPGPNARFRPWWETWMLMGCGHKFEVPINFTPDERGTMITQALGDVKGR